LKAGVLLKIVYRIVSALLALCVIPAAYFLSFLKYGFSAVVINIGDEVSIKYLFDQFLDKNSPLNGLFGGSGDFFANASVKSLMPAGISFLVFFALAILISLVVFFFAAFSNMRLTITCLGAGGFLSIIGVYISFGRFAAPLLSGSTAISDFLNIGSLGFLVDSAIKIEIFRLTSATMIMGLIFSLIVIWGLAFVLTDDGSEKIRDRNLKTKK
jgi:hypothetical protein